MLSYARRELLRNPRQTLASLVGVALGIGLFSGVLFFIDGSGASMTARAIAPVALDMQRVLTSPLGEGVRLEERLSARGALRPGERTTVILTVRNHGAAAANEVVVGDRLPGALEYVPRSATRDGVPLPDIAGQSPLAHGPALIGHNLGTVAPGATVTLRYLARAGRPIPAAARASLGGTISTREDPVPDPANAPDLIPQDELRARIAAIPGVAAADELAFADLRPGSLRLGGAAVDRPIRVFGFDRAYAEHHPSIRLAAGAFEPDAALLSPESARGLGARPGDTVELILPGRAERREVRVSGIADLSRARPLFNSRKGSKLEDFLYIADSIVLSPEAFRRIIVPAFRAAGAARGNALGVKSPPTLEVDVLVERSRLGSAPEVALVQTEDVASAIERIAPGQDFLLDNISNTLQVARSDAAVAKRMFLFLGLPGLLLAAFLAAYAGKILAGARRREQATLRLRGAHRGHLLRILAYRTVALAGVGSVLGTLAGFGSAAAILGPGALLEAAPGQLAASTLLAIGAGVATTGLALYLPGRRSLRREVIGERREMTAEPTSAWRRLRLDYAAVALATATAVLAIRAGAFDTPPGSVSTGQAISLPSHLLLLPLAAWFAGTLLSVRAVEFLARRLPVTPAPRFGPLVWGVLGRSLRRRSGALVTGVVGVGLVVAFGTALAVFTATYDDAKAADSELTVGSNLRVTPSPLSVQDHPPGFAAQLLVPGVSTATPVVWSVENAFLRSDFNSDVKDLAAIDPVGFLRTAALSDSFFPGSSAAEAMAALQADPRAILLDAESAGVLKLRPGDTADVLLARGTRRQQLRRMTVAGLFERFPGFPEGLHIVANLAYYQAETRSTEVDFFLARTTAQGSAGLQGAISALGSGPAARDRLDIDSTETILDKDQSSLTSVNVRGLLDLDSVYTLLIAASVIAIFVFGLMLQRRREYLTLLAQGIPPRDLQALVLGEAGFVALGGLLVGLLVGSGMGLLLVRILEPLFILQPVTAVPFGRAALITGMVLAATLVSTWAALAILRRLSPSEVLREQ